MRKIAIKIDREAGYQGDFAITKNPQYFGEVGDINREGQALKSRDARMGSTEKKSPYLKLEEEKKPETPKKLFLAQKAGKLVDSSSGNPTPIVPYFKTKSSGKSKLDQKHEDDVDEITQKLASKKSSIAEEKLTVEKPLSSRRSPSSSDEETPKIRKKLFVKVDSSSENPTPVVPYFKTKFSGTLKLNQKHEDDVDEITKKPVSKKSSISGEK